MADGTEPTVHSKIMGMEGHCAFCGQESDTAIGVRGNRGWLEMTLHMLGADHDSAQKMVEMGINGGAVTRTMPLEAVRQTEPRATEEDPMLEMGVMVCLDCAAKMSETSPYVAQHFPTPA